MYLTVNIRYVYYVNPVSAIRNIHHRSAIIVKYLNILSNRHQNLTILV